MCSSFLVFNCSSDSITFSYTLSKIDFSSGEILPNTWEIVLKLVIPSIDGGDPIPILILLKVDPPLGRALIENALLKFLLKKDYELETGNEYKFTISAKF